MRRDYILDAAKEFGVVVASILGHSQQARWQDATVAVAQEYQRLVGVDAAEALRMSDTELFARLIQGGPTHLAASRVFMLATLFKASGNVSAGQGRAEESRQYYLKALYVLLDALDRTGINERPDYAPTVETLFVNLGDMPLSSATHALLMRHYERMGEFGKAEDALFAIAEIEPPGAGLLQFGEAFYARLLARSDDALVAGNLSRGEAESGLADFRGKMRQSQI